MKVHKILFQTIINKIKDELFFSDFKYRKRDNTLLKESNKKIQIIEFQNWEGVNPDTKKSALVIKPLFLIRFNTIHEWFEKYSFKTLRDQKDNFTIGFDGKMLDKEELFYFDLDKQNHSVNIEVFVSHITETANQVFIKYVNLESLYEFYIEPILKGTAKLPLNGSDWFFNYLRICQLVNKEEYYNLLNILFPHFKELYDRREPNIVEYYPRIDDILNDLRKQE